MNYLILILSTIIIFVSHSHAALADTERDFNSFMNEWNEKRVLASKHLLEAENLLKQGNKILGCSKQREASQFGIEASKALINAMKANGSDDGLENFEAGMNKWRELGDFC